MLFVKYQDSSLWMFYVVMKGNLYERYYLQEGSLGKTPLPYLPTCKSLWTGQSFAIMINTSVQCFEGKQ